MYCLCSFKKILLLIPFVQEEKTKSYLEEFCLDILIHPLILVTSENTCVLNLKYFDLSNVCTESLKENRTFN